MVGNTALVPDSIMLIVRSIAIQGKLVRKDPVLYRGLWGCNADFPRFIAFISGIVRKYSAFYSYPIAV